jgi:cytochrome b561
MDSIMRDNTTTEIASYNPIQRGFHWLMAAVILTAICVGIYAADLPKEDPTKGFWFGIHKSLGMTAFFLAILRIGWRLLHSAPGYRVALGRFTALAAGIAHYALYILMVAVPVGGYVLSTASGRPVTWFGLFTFPSVIPVDKSLAKLADGAHVTGAFILIAVIALHIAAALWHHWFKRDEVMARMAPRLASKSQKV